MLWADVLYAGDQRWWAVYGDEVEAKCASERWSGAQVGGVSSVEVVDDPGLCTKPGRIHAGGHSGYQAIGLAFNFGPPRRIILLGYDMQRGPGGRAHHHGNHPQPLPNLKSDMADWVRRLVPLGIDLRRLGIEVLNATRSTAITCFERIALEDALKRVSPIDPMTASLLIPEGLLPAERVAFETGLAAAGYRIGGTPNPALSVVWGARDRASGKVLVAENGYLDGQGGPYVALAVGGHNGSGRSASPDRGRLQALGAAIQPWRTTGGHVLVCPSRGLPTSVMPQPDGWTERTVEALKGFTDRPIRVRPHPGNWKRNRPPVALEDDLRGAWACVIWASSVGVKALIAGVPVIYQAPHWICAEAAGNRLQDIEAPSMPDRRPALERMAAAQFSLDEIASGAPFRELLGLTVLCVLKSGGDTYNVEYVRKLRDGVARHLTIPHRFVCLSDVPVPCERIALKHGWPGWWSKLEVFRPDVITGPTLYLDLDTVIVGNLDSVSTIPYDFAMLNIRAKDTKVGNSGAMWIARPFPHVYERFAEKPQDWIDFHIKNAHDRYAGDQAFISDSFDEIPKLHHALPGFFLSFKYDKQQESVSPGCSVVCFGGKPRPHEALGWVQKAWV